MNDRVKILWRKNYRQTGEQEEENVGERGRKQGKWGKIMQGEQKIRGYSLKVGQGKKAFCGKVGCNFNQ